MNTFVTKPSVPNKKKFNFFLKNLYKTRMLTTNGKLVPLLEKKLKKVLGVKYLILVCNGTIALQIAIKALKVKKGILTTPFSYVSTPNSAQWLNIKTYFSDIEKNNYSIDITKINKKKINYFDCIIPTHVFGLNGNIDELEKFSKRYNKKIIYDAAHCFGINYKKKSILNYGDASTLSFQATKIFNTCEGGAVIFKNKKNYDYARKLVNIGYDYSKKNGSPIEGTNAKMSELNAAWGLALLQDYKKIINRKKYVYDEYLKKLNLSKIEIIKPSENNNYNYFPVIFSTEEKKFKIVKKLNLLKIYPRQYFYPSLNKLTHLMQKRMPISEGVAGKILCLPIYENLNKKTINKISEIVNLYA
ncbi:DegT/DnrJ/EryC1/StrS family aminotransferase [Candidatus Pelagibacter sp.]|uniref:DegT/DnrJ/EryC1/StrS family aminotransferase n=1 Tax=Candidatus Pelagibacter sp. TaxID=2024849 RepID=UPI003F86E4C4